MKMNLNFERTRTGNYFKCCINNISRLDFKRMNITEKRLMTIAKHPSSATFGEIVMICHNSNISFDTLSENIRLDINDQFYREKNNGCYSSTNH